MKSFFEGKSLKHVLIGVLFILFLIQFVATGIVFYLFSYQKSFSIAINIAGRQRMLSQKMTKEIFIYAKEPTEKNKEAFLKTAELFDKSLNALRYGDKRLGLDSLSDPNAIKSWKRVKELWDEFYKNIKIIIT